MNFGVLVLADVMWRDKQTGGAGVRYEFFDNEDRDQWAGGLIDGRPAFEEVLGVTRRSPAWALLARFAVG